MRCWTGPASRLLIGPFVRRQGIDLGDYVPARYASFNDFFCRRIRSELRPVDQNPAALIAPCDGLLSAYPVEQGVVIPAKQSRYTLAQLLGSQALAAPFSGGWCLVFRLAVRHYHRYCFPDNGVIADYGFLPGVLHTVRPVALARGPVFCQNCRAYTVLEAAHLGHAVQLEVGAMLVGRIVNRKQTGAFARGEEKGLFQYGGGTSDPIAGTRPHHTGCGAAARFPSGSGDTGAPGPAHRDGKAGKNVTRESKARVAFAFFWYIIMKINAIMLRIQEGQVWRKS